MSRWFLDASVLLASEDPDDRSHASARQLLGGDDVLATLDLAFYEVTNVAVRSWRDPAAARRLIDRVDAVADDGGLIRADTSLLTDAAALAQDRQLSIYDAAYVVASALWDGRLVSCDVRDLVSKRLALLPDEAVAVERGVKGGGPTGLA